MLQEALLSESPSGRRADRKTVIIIVSVIAVIFTAVIYLNEAVCHLDFIPTWKELYEGAGLTETVYNDIADGETAVHFIDVGQGDCELIDAGGSYVLIDSGEYSEAGKVTGYLNNLGVSRLEYIIVSHPHSDHMGSMAKIVETFDVGTVIMADITEEMLPVTSSYVKLIEAIDRKNIPIAFAEAGDSFTLNDGRLLILAPVKDYDDLNNYSLVVKYIHGDNSFLFTGDIEEKAERDIIGYGSDVSAEVLKIPHHGSDTSSCKIFIQSVNPQYGVIEVGDSNDYGHPHSEPMKLYEKLGVKIYRTDMQGNIVFVSDGKDYRIITSEDKAFIGE